MKHFTVAYYHDSVLMQEMLSLLIHWCHCCRDGAILHQDSAPANHAHQTIELLQRETPKFISPD